MKEIKDLLKDMDLKRGYSKKYTGALSNLINTLNWFIEHETHDELREEFKSLEKLISERLHGILEMFKG